MPYQSPFHFFSPDVTFPLDPLVVQRARKKMLAEFDLGSASVQGLSKHDALQWLESISAEELSYHQLIYERPVILNFLERGDVSGERWYATLPGDERARSFVLALVQQQFNLLFAAAFQSDDIQRLEQLKKFELPELDKKGRYYYSATANLFTSYYHRLGPLVQDVSGENVNALQEFIGQPFLRTMAILPPYFDSMRNEFANTMLQVVPRLADEAVGAKAVAFSVSNAARTVAASQEIKAAAKRLANQHVPGADEISSSGKGTSAEPPPKKKRYGCIAAAIIVIVLLRLLLTLLHG